jgi:hypothetical protein
MPADAAGWGVQSGNCGSRWGDWVRKTLDAATEASPLPLPLPLDPSAAMQCSDEARGQSAAGRQSDGPIRVMLEGRSWKVGLREPTQAKGI